MLLLLLWKTLRSFPEIQEVVEISQTSIRRLLKRNKFHAYHIQLHQALSEDDFQQRVAFCEWAGDKIQENPNFFQLVLFSDEATFHSSGFINTHNYHYYDNRNPHFTRYIDHQHRWSLNVYGALLGNYTIGPYFFDIRLNGQEYLNFLNNHLFHLLEHVPLETRRNMWLQHDGAPAHYFRNVREYLDDHFGGKWIGRGGPVRWPARSPDLTPIDFFLWGHIKNIVYRIPPTTADDMKIRIRDAFRGIDADMMRNVHRSFQDRIRLCQQHDGRHFEQYLN